MVGFSFSQEYPMPAMPPSLTDKFVANAISGMKIDGQKLTVRSTRPLEIRSRTSNAAYVLAIPTAFPSVPSRQSTTPPLRFAMLRPQEMLSSVLSDCGPAESSCGENERVSLVEYLQYGDDGKQSATGRISATIFRG